MQPPPGVLDRSNVGRLTSAVALVTALVAATTSAADAGNWATPAAGPSTSGGPEVLFTFDDGPTPATTPKILDALAAHHVQAVFFMVGWRFQRGNVDKTRDLMHRILDAGHVVANHTVSHAHLCTGNAKLTEQLVERHLRRLTGRAVTDSGVAERTAKATEDTARNTKRIERAISDNAIAFA